MNEELIEAISKTLDHIRNVQDNCFKLGKQLIKIDKTKLGISLIQRGLTHDVSKLSSQELEGIVLQRDKEKLAKAVEDHRKKNKHHPESWPSIQCMDDLSIAEFVCDTKARSAEMGTGYREWIDNVATERYGFCKGDECYNRIVFFIDLLLEKPFTAIKAE